MRFYNHHFNCSLLSIFIFQHLFSGFKFLFYFFINFTRFMILRIFESAVRRARYTYAYIRIHIYTNVILSAYLNIVRRYNYLNACRDLFAWDLEAIVFFYRRRISGSIGWPKTLISQFVVPHIRMIVFTRT